MDAIQDSERLLLFLPVDEDAGGNGQTADGDRGDAVVFVVGHDATDLVGVVELCGAVLLRRGGFQRVDLVQETHGHVVEETAYYCGAADEPGWVVSEKEGGA
jgi:hypothetical protein